MASAATASTAALEDHPLERLIAAAHVRFVGQHQPPSAAEAETAAANASATRASDEHDDETATEHQPWAGVGLGPGDGPSLTHWIADSLFASGLYWGLHIEELLGKGAIDRRWAMRRLGACRVG